MRTLPQRIGYGLAMLTLATAAAILIVVLVWLVYPYRGITEAELKILTPNARAGDLVTYSIRYCVDETVPLPMRVSRELELQGSDPAVTFQLPDIEYVIRERCETRERAIGIPEYVPPGFYHVHSFTSLEVNPFRRIRQVFVSNAFRIEKNGTAGTAR